MTSEVEHGGYPRYHPTPLRRSCGILVRCWRRTTSLFPPPPAPPSSTTALGCGGLLTLTLRGKAMDGFEEQQERNRPQLSPPSLETRRTDAGFPQASTGRRRSVAWRSLGLSLHHERNIQSTGVRRRQHNQPVHQIGADSLRPKRSFRAAMMRDSGSSSSGSGPRATVVRNGSSWPPLRSRASFPLLVCWMR